MIIGITLILLGLLAVPSLVLSKKPEAQEILGKIAPYQGWFGVVACFWGIWGVIFSGILGLKWMSHWPIYWVTALAVNLLQAALGFILGYNLIAKYFLSNSEAAKAKGQQLQAKLAGIQGKLGLAGIGVGIWSIIAFLVFYGA